MSQPSKGIALLLAAVFGPLGIDKFYVGATSIGVLQLLLSITIIGLLVSIPWAWLSVVVLILLIFLGKNIGLYPTVDWAPTSMVDKVIAGIIIGLFVLSVAGGVYNRDNVSTKLESMKIRMKEKFTNKSDKKQ